MKRDCLKNLCSIVVAMLGMSLAENAWTATIYFDDFSGSNADPLHGTAPDVRPGSETWLAASIWRADGSAVPSGDLDGAVLPFVPTSGKIYELSADFTLTAAFEDEWLALGFLTGDAGDSILANGAPWALQRGNGPLGQVLSILGTNLAGLTTEGTYTPNPTSIKIVLNTQADQWTAEWILNGSSVTTTAFPINSNPNITYVTMSHNRDVTGSLDNFLLTVVPEPSAFGLLSVGLLGLTWLRRRSHR